MRTLMTLALIAKMTNPTFLRGEGIYLTLDVSNSGSEAVELRCPVSGGQCSLFLTTPEGERIYAGRGASLNPSIPDFVWGQTPEPTSVAPDVRWSGLVHLEELFDFKTNGRYGLEVSCSWDQIRLESAPLEFRVEDLEVLQVSRGSEGGWKNGDTGLVFLRETREGREFLYSYISDVHDECGFRGTPRLGGPQLIRSLPKGAADPLHPSSTPAKGLGFGWKFWREGNALRWIYVSDDKTMPLPGTVDRLIDPALQDGESGVNHVYALCTKEGIPRLVVVRVMAYLEPHYQPERILAELPLAVRPLSAAAEIHRIQGHPRRSVILGAIDGQAPRVDWGNYSGEAVPENLRSHVWKTSAAAEAIPDARPAILTLQDGGVRIAWLAREAGRPERGLFCRATFDASGTLQSEAVTGIHAGAPIVAGRTVFVGDAPVVALWTEDGGVRAGAPADLKQLERPGKRRVTPTIVVFYGTPYVLDLSPAKGLVLLPIPGFEPQDR